MITREEILENISNNISYEKFNQTQNFDYSIIGNWILSHLLLNISLIINIIFIIVVFLNIIKIPLFDSTRYRGVIFNTDGSLYGTFKIKKNQLVQKYKYRSYHFKPNHSSFFMLTFLFWRSKYFFYQLDNPDPLYIKTSISPIIDAQTYDAVLDSDLIKKINNWGKKNLLAELLTPRNLIILAVFLAIFWYFYNGGTLTSTGLQ